jgi:hypothetical protein
MRFNLVHRPLTLKGVLRLAELVDKLLRDRASASHQPGRSQHLKQHIAVWEIHNLGFYGNDHISILE